MRKIAVLISAIVLLCGCNTISSIIHDDQVVARVGLNKLYMSELQKYVPDYVSPEDSANFARNYINSWAMELLYLQVADEHLSAEEMDVTEELEDYRRSLLKYRYEQRYINDRLDTLVTAGQIEEYYEAHKGLFSLERPILKVRFVDVMKDSPSREKILRLMSSPRPDDLLAADTLARQAALRWFDRSEEWTDALVLSREFGMDYNSMLSLLSGSFIKLDSPDRGDLVAAYVCDIRRSGTAPVEYCEARIRDYILSARKHELLLELERDLLDDALDRKTLVIY